jgi:hypothetical protein
MMPSPTFTPYWRHLASSWYSIVHTLCAGIGVGVFVTGATASEQASQQQIAIGTLFYSPMERVAINRERVEGSSTATSTQVSVSGVVKRDHGNSTVWINGKAVREGQALPQTRQTRISANGVLLDGQRIQVGETVDLNTHQRSDVVPPGAVSNKEQK